MAWGSAKRRISGKIARGDFQKPDNTLQKGIMAAGDIAVSKIMKAEEEERLEKRRQKAAAAAEAKRLADEQRKKEEEAKKLARQAKAVATRYNASDNPAAVNYITEQLYTFGDSAAALIESDIKSGRLSFVNEMRDRPLQGPDVPRDFATPITIGEGEDQNTFSTFEDSNTPITAGDLAGISTNENNSEAIRTEAGQMAEIFAPVSEEPAVTLPYKGVEINPDANNVEVDWSKVTDETQVKYYRRMHDAGKQILDAEDLAVLEAFEKDFEDGRLKVAEKEALELNREMTGYSDDRLLSIVQTRDGEVYSPAVRSTAQRILEARKKQAEIDNQPDPVEIVKDLAQMDATERSNLISGLAPLVTEGDETAKLITETAAFMEAKEPEDFTKFFSGINTVAGVESKIAMVKASGLTDVDQQKVINQLNEHKKTLEALDTDLNLTDQTYYGSVIIDNVATQAELIMNADGKLYSPSLKKTFERKAVTNLISTDNAEGLRQDATTLQDDVFNPMIEQRSGIKNLLMQAVEIDQLVEGADGKVLTFMGGRLPSILQRVQNEYKAFDSFLRGGNQEQIAALASEYTEDELAKLSEIGISADEFSRFQAMAIEFAFTYARTGMGQTRTTDQDFQAAYKVVTAGSSYPTYTKNLRGLVTKGLNRATNEHDQYLNYPTLKAAMLRPGAKEIHGQFMQSLADYLSAQGKDVAAQIKWSQTEYVAPASNGDTVVKTTPKTPEAVLQETLDQYQNEAAFTNDRKAVSQMSESDKATYIGIIAKQKGIPVNVLTDLLTSN
jgi:hypothetical protein